MKTYVSIFKFVARVNLEFMFNNFHCVYLSLFKNQLVCVPKANFKICGSSKRSSSCVCNGNL